MVSVLCQLMNGAVAYFNVDYPGNITNNGTITTAGEINANGGIKINNYSLPLFRNGQVSAASNFVIPVYFSSSNYSYAEIKLSFQVSTISNITMYANTAVNNTGTNILPQENGEIATAFNSLSSPTYTQSGTLATNVPAVGIMNQIKIYLTKGSGSGTYAQRNYYNFENSVCQNGVGTMKVSGFGHLDSGSLACVVVQCNTGTMTGYWNTIHYY